MPKHIFQLAPGMEISVSVNNDKMTVSVDRPKKDEALKSAHKAGEPYDEEHEYAGELRVPTAVDIWLGIEGVVTECYGDGCPLVCSGKPLSTANNGLREILRPRTVNRNAEPVKDKPAKPQYKVGDVVMLEGVGCLPNGCYKILANDVLPKGGEIYIGAGVGALLAIANHEAHDEKRTIIAPMPSTGYYDFLVEGVKFRAYEADKKYLIYVTKDATCHSHSLNAIIVPIFSAVDARLKKERGYGIIPVPYSVSEGDFEAPEA